MPRSCFPLKSSSSARADNLTVYTTMPYDSKLYTEEATRGESCFPGRRYKNHSNFPFLRMKESKLCATAAYDASFLWRFHRLIPLIFNCNAACWVYGRIVVLTCDDRSCRFFISDFFSLQMGLSSVPITQTFNPNL